MIVCPLCEHPQAEGVECEVCGKKLLQVAPAPLPPTPFPEIELTRLRGGPDLPPAPVPDLELPRAQVGEVQVQLLAELEQHRLAQNPAERTAGPTAEATCRYCRNVQSVGRVCDRCGMRLPRYHPPAPEVTDSKAAVGPVVVHSCGARTPAGARCTSCGAQVPLPT